MTDIRLDVAYFDYEVVERLIRASRRVGKYYGTRRYAHPLHLLTMSPGDIPDFLVDDDVATALAGHDGMCWPSGYVWVRNRGVPTYEAQILAHEVAHLITFRSGRVHGAEWRRTYMRLVGLWQFALTGVFPNYSTLAAEVVGKYGANVDGTAEVAALVDAAEESWHMFSPQLLTQT